MDFPRRIRTRRLMLTRIERSDAGDIDRLPADAPSAPLFGAARARNAVALVEELMAEWDRHGYGLWVARDPHEGRFVGGGGVRPAQPGSDAEGELVCALMPEYRQGGYGSELTRVAVAQGFIRAGLQQIVGFTPPGNDASRRLMEKTGLAYEREVMRAGEAHALFRLRMQAWLTAPLLPPQTPSRPVELATA